MFHKTRKLILPALASALTLLGVARGEIVRESIVPINFDPGQPISGGVVIAGFPSLRIEATQIRALSLSVRAVQEGVPDRAGMWDWDAGDAAYVLELAGEGWQTVSASVPPPYSRWMINGTGFATPQFVLEVLPGVTTTFLARVELRVFYVPVCVADYDNGSGLGFPDLGVTIDDLVYYLALFGEGDTRADNDDGSGTGTQDQGVTIDDLIYYLDHYQAGC